jgi:sulfite reductase (NADPH) hemoprotein beta-component
VPDAIERLIQVYLERRDADAERFIDVVRRIGVEPFKERVYAENHQASADRERRLAAA